MSSGAYTLRLARTLYNEVYRAMLYNENQQPIAKLRIVPNIPLDRSQVPEDAPVVPAFLLVIVDDADINKDNLIDFEERASYALLKRFSTEVISFHPDPWHQGWHQESLPSNKSVEDPSLPPLLPCGCQQKCWSRLLHGSQRDALEGSRPSP